MMHLVQGPYSSLKNILGHLIHIYLLNKVNTGKILGNKALQRKILLNFLEENLNDTFWLVDPIDGTNDYINNKEEFTINAGLILNRKPVAGLIYAPAKKRMFYSYGEGLPSG